MANVKKITKRENFEGIKAILINMDIDNKEQYIDFINHELELLDKKALSRGTSKTSQEQEELMTMIVDNLKTIGRSVTITELQKESAEMAEYSNQKLSAMLKKLVDSGVVAKSVDKKKSYFRAI